jgi:hypothetical protein
MLGVRCQGELPAKSIDFCGAEGGFDANSAARHFVKNQPSLQPLAAVVERIGKSCIGGEVCARAIKIV